MNELFLIDQCTRQDKAAQQQLFDAFAPALLPVCIRYVRDFHDAEEALLNGFYKFFKNIAAFEYRGTGSIQAWLKKIMVNECLMQLRSRNTMQQLGIEPALTISGDTNALADLGAKEIYRLIATLPDGYRTVFNLYAVEGYTHREIAALLQISEGTSKSQLSKARAMLQQSLQKKHSYYATGK